MKLLSAEMACLLGVQNKIQAVWGMYFDAVVVEVKTFLLLFRSPWVMLLLVQGKKLQWNQVDKIRTKSLQNPL